MKTYHGSCHCGAVRFEARFDLAAGTIRCNCSICTKKRWWGAMVKPQDFHLLAGEEALEEYTFGRHIEKHRFCRHCGVQPFVLGESPVRGEFVAVNVGTLDGVDDAELAAAPIRYIDGRHDRWDAAPAETRYL
jgi:hypothetical protein